jgi:hypothetical protein
MLKILDGSGESGKSLSEQDVKDFLTTKVLNVHLGTVDVLVAQKIHMRYLGNLEHPVAHELIDAIKKGQSVVLEISPKYYSTWDYGKQ